MFKVCDELDDCLIEMNRHYSLAIVMSREYFHYNQLSRTLPIFCYENSDIIYDYSIKLLVSKKFMLLRELNEFMRMASEGGLIEKWRRSSRIRFSSKHNILNFKPIQMAQFSGLLIIYCVPVFLLVLLLIIENIGHKKVNQPNSSRIWILIEKLIDSERYFLLDNKLY